MMIRLARLLRSQTPPVFALSMTNSKWGRHSNVISVETTSQLDENVQHSPRTRTLAETHHGEVGSEEPMRPPTTPPPRSGLTFASIREEPRARSAGNGVYSLTKFASVAPIASIVAFAFQRSFPL